MISARLITEEQKEKQKNSGAIEYQTERKGGG